MKNIKIKFFFVLSILSSQFLVACQNNSSSEFDESMVTVFFDGTAQSYSERKANKKIVAAMSMLQMAVKYGKLDISEKNTVRLIVKNNDAQVEVVVEGGEKPVHYMDLDSYLTNERDS